MFGHNGFDTQVTRHTDRFNSMFKGIILFWILSALLSVGITVSVIVLLIKISQHF
jgi:hypothetical protein